MQFFLVKPCSFGPIRYLCESVGAGRQVVVWALNGAALVEIET